MGERGVYVGNGWLLSSWASGEEAGEGCGLFTHGDLSQPRNPWINAPASCPSHKQHATCTIQLQIYCTTGLTRPPSPPPRFSRHPHRYLTYGEEKWQADTVAALEAMELYSEEAKNGFRHTLGEGGIQDMVQGLGFRGGAAIQACAMQSGLRHHTDCSLYAFAPLPPPGLLPCPLPPPTRLAAAVGLFSLLWPGHAPALG